MMRKLSLVIALVLVITALLSVFAFGVDLPLRVVVNGDRLYFPDAQPFIDSNGRTQTPARFIGEELGATVSWDGTAQKATFVKGSKKLILYVGKKEYELDGKKLQMDTAALLQEGRTFVPARYVAEAFGATVKWDSAVKTVYIDTLEVVSTPEPKITQQPRTIKATDKLTDSEKKAIANRFREWHDFDLKSDKKNIFNYLSTEYKNREGIKTYEDIVFPLYKEGELFPYNNPSYMYISSAVKFAKERTGYTNDSDFIVLCFFADYDKTHYKVMYGLFDNKNINNRVAYAYGYELVVKENGNWFFDNVGGYVEISEHFYRNECY